MAIVWEEFSFLNPLNLWTQQEVSLQITAGHPESLERKHQKAKPAD